MQTHWSALEHLEVLITAVPGVPLRCAVQYREVSLLSVVFIRYGLWIASAWVIVTSSVLPHFSELSHLCTVCFRQAS